MTQDELNEILENHLKWLKHEDGGVCAILRGVDLSGMILSETVLWGADLSGADLHEANIRNADLNHVDLSYANLNHTDLSGSDLRYAKLCGANLSCSNLKGAHLSGANLYGSIFRWANLHNTILTGANLKDACLYGANLEGANLSCSNLKGAHLSGANLSGSLLDKSEKVRVGEILKEKILGYKKTLEDKIITLEIPKGAIVFSINNDKCRTNKAKVIECEGVQHSRYDCRFKYVEGKEIEIEDFDLMYNNECGAGIHFFKTKKEAEEYNYF